MTSVVLDRGGARIVGYDHGTGLPVLFQHGLGSDLDQVAETLVDLPGVRRLTIECRGHGASTAGTERPFSLAMFADDALAFAACRGVTRFVAGGISMGAGLALRLAITRPEQVSALVLVRPAWLFDTAPPGLAGHRALAEALRSTSQAKFRSGLARVAARLAGDPGQGSPSLLRWIEQRDPGVAASVIGDIARDGLGVTADQVAAVRIPTLVIGHEGDPLHPMETARVLAALIPSAALIEVPGKEAPTKDAHLAAIAQAVTAFLKGLPRS